MSRFCVEIFVLNHPEELAQEWLGLQKKSDCSYFQSWSWIEAWLKIVVNTLQPQVIRIKLDNEVIGLGLFVERDVRRRRFFQSCSLFLNEYPFDGRDMITQYNGMLVRKGLESEAHQVLANYFQEHLTKYDEFHFRAIPSDKQFLKKIDCTKLPFKYIVNEEWTTWQVDLTQFSGGLDGYLAKLSRNRRGQIKRSMRLYNKEGGLKIEEAKELSQALEYFERLKVLHTKYWNAKSIGGSFGGSLWEKFNRHLIMSNFKRGDVQLLKISGDKGEIGYIYNLIFEQKVSVIQTGFVRTEDKKLMPGYVSHVLAIAYNQSKKLESYDFLHGFSLYKELLSNKKQTLVVSVLQRKKIKFQIESLLVRMVRKIRNNDLDK